MADDSQYIKLPDGSYGQFDAGASDDIIRSKIMQAFPNAYKPQAQLQNEAQAAANPPADTRTVPNIIMQPAEFGGRYSGPVQTRDRKELVSPQESMQGIATKMQDSPTPMTNAVSSLDPIGATRAIVGSRLASYVAKPLGPWAQTAAGLLGGTFAGMGPQIGENISRSTYEPPDKISLGPFGKINRNVPQEPYEEMGNSAQYRQQAASVGKVPKGTSRRMTLPWEQGSTSAPQDVAQSPQVDLPPAQGGASPNISYVKNFTAPGTNEEIPAGSVAPDDLIARSIAERAARGAKLTLEEEEILRAHVQRNFDEGSGMDTAAQRSGKIYAGRGTAFRPTNEQILIGNKYPWSK